MAGSDAIFCGEWALAANSWRALLIRLQRGVFLDAVDAGGSPQFTTIW